MTPRERAIARAREVDFANPSACYEALIEAWTAAESAADAMRSMVVTLSGAHHKIFCPEPLDARAGDGGARV